MAQIPKFALIMLLIIDNSHINANLNICVNVKEDHLKALNQWLQRENTTFQQSNIGY
jgi:hypothetical protein